MSDLGGELLVSLGMTAAMILLHMSGLMLLVRTTRLHIKHFRTGIVQVDSLLVPLAMGIGIFMLHGAEVWSYAWLYESNRAVHGWEEAIFLSAGAYSTAGWMGVNVVDGWRVAAVLEALTGMLLMGWSTAFLFQTLHRILQTDENHPLPEGAITEGIDQEEVAETDADDGKDSPRPSRSGKGAPSGTNSSDTELMQ
jgi:voltage-gated potassium channel